MTDLITSPVANTIRRHALVYSLVAIGILSGCAQPLQGTYVPVSANADSFSQSFTAASHNESPLDRALSYLRQEMDVYHGRTVVYDDHESGGARYTPSGWMRGPDPDWSEATRTLRITHPRHGARRGATCMKIEWAPEADHHWAGVFFQNVDDNWGEYPGRDLTGATTLSFWARGQCGNEVVECKFAGLDCRKQESSRDVPRPNDSKCRYWDSCEAISTGSIILCPHWKKYTLDLRGKCLQNILGGFCIVFSAAPNVQGCTLYLDEIVIDDCRLYEPRLIRSYRAGTADLKKLLDDNDLRQLRSIAYVYDNACATSALISMPTLENRLRARQLADAFVDLLAHHERNPKCGAVELGTSYLLNAYSCGDVFEWTSTDSESNPNYDAASGEQHATKPLGNSSNSSMCLEQPAFAPRMPGSENHGIDKEANPWLTDQYSMGVDTGNLAHCMLALLNTWADDGATPDSAYLAAAEKVGRWILRNCKRTYRLENRDFVVFHGGYEWKPSEPGAAFKYVPVPWVSTEHAIDLAVAFHRLAEARPNGDEASIWSEASTVACNFVVWAASIENSSPTNPKPIVTGSSEEAEAKGKTQAKSLKFPIPDSHVLNVDGGEQHKPLTASRNVLPLDPQTWSVLAFVGTPIQNRATRAGLSVSRLRQALAWAATDLRAGTRIGELEGYTFANVVNQDLSSPRTKKHQRGTWPEGTAQIVLAKRKLLISYAEDSSQENIPSSEQLIRFLDHLVQNDSSGGMPAAHGMVVDQGFDKFGKMVSYVPLPHLGATAWYLMARTNFNHFWGTRLGRESLWLRSSD